MFAHVEEFYRPSSAREALRLLEKGRGGARVVAGGTDLVLHVEDSVRTLIDITRAGLSYIKPGGGRLAIGATTTLAELEESAAVRGLAGGILAHAAAACGSVQIRNLATIGGNVVHGSPAADLTVPLLALDALVVLVSLNGSRRKIRIADYLGAPRNRDRARTLVAEFQIPEPPANGRCGWSFQKLGRTALDISLVSVVAGLELDGRRKVKWARIALGAVAPAPLRALATEAFMAGRVLDRALLDEIDARIACEVSPVSDQRAPAEYRREMSVVLTRRAVEECAAHARWTL